MKQEDSLSVGPCSPSSQLSSTPPGSHCSSRPASPLPCSIQHHPLNTPPITSSATIMHPEPTPSINFRIPDFETSLITEECIDGSELDQYLPVTPAGYSSAHALHSKHVRFHSQHSDPEDNNNTHDVTMTRYHELQPSDSLIKNERYANSNHAMYNYQNGVPLNSSAGYYSGNLQYLSNYQYSQQQRPMFTNGSYVGPTGNSNEGWTNYA